MKITADMVHSRQPNSGECSELEYRRKWLYQLQDEFRKICSWYRISLAVPAFRISDSTTMLGSWSPETRAISLSAALISGYSWDAVINVLKHEMAHQYVHEFMDRGMEQPHGQAFMDACDRLGVLSPFNTAGGDTPKAFAAENALVRDPEYDRRVNKVRKMLSLAGSCNRHEAEAAMNKANCFIRKYNLARLDTAGTAKYSYEIVETGKKRLQVIERRIASLLNDYFYVDIIYAELFDPTGLESFKTIELLGSSENVAIARHVYDFLSHRIDYLWQQYRKSTNAPGKLRKTYILGLLQGFREKLAAEEGKFDRPHGLSGGKNGAKTISALVVAKDPGLAQYTAQRFPRLRRVQYRLPGIHCSRTYSAGKTEGRKITVHRSVRHADGNRGRLLSR